MATGNELERDTILTSSAIQEANEFTAAVLDDTKLPIKLTNAVKAVQIGSYLQEALETGDKLYFDEVGRRIEKSRM